MSSERQDKAYLVGEFRPLKEWQELENARKAREGDPDRDYWLERARDIAITGRVT